jgi:hypothetical protein
MGASDTKILSLKHRLGYEKRLWILGFELLDDGRLFDPFHGAEVFNPAKAIPATAIPSRYSAIPEMYCLLCRYADAREHPLTGEWISLADVDRVQRQELPSEDCTELLSYVGKDFEVLARVKVPFFSGRIEGGDLAFEVWPLPRVPLRFLLWQEDEEVTAGGSVLFDRSAIAYLGDLVGELVWLTVWRLRNILKPEIKWGYHGLKAGAR